MENLTYNIFYYRSRIRKTVPLVRRHRDSNPRPMIDHIIDPMRYQLSYRASLTKEVVTTHLQTNPMEDKPQANGVQIAENQHTIQHNAGPRKRSTW